jgi:hypothetical protein
VTRVAAALALAVLCALPPFADLVAQGGAQLSAPRARLVEELRLDGNTEDFSPLGRIFVGARGQIAVPLRQDYHVRLHDSTGRRVATVGRRGAGPGEFQTMTIGGWSADTLWIFDIEQRRSVYVSPGGHVLRTVPLPPSAAPMHETEAGQLNWFVPLATLTDGTLIGDGRYTQSPRAAGEYPTLLRRFVRVTPSGDITVVADAPGYEDQPWYLTVAGFGRIVPFTATPHVALAADGSRIATLTTAITTRSGGTLAVTMLDANGRSVYAREFAFQGAPIPQRATDSALAAMLPRPGAATEGPADMPRRFQALARDRMPPVYPPVFGIIVGQDGTLWITLRRTDEGQIAVMLDARGMPRQSVLLPRSTRIWHATADRLWTTQADADGMHHVVRYRVVRE